MQRINYYWMIIKKNLLKPVTFYCAIAVYIFYAFVFGSSGLVKYLDLTQDRKKIERQIAIAQERNDFLKTEIEKLSDPNDLARIELEARKQGMAARDEVIIKIRE